MKVQEYDIQAIRHADFARGLEFYCKYHGVNDNESYRMTREIAESHPTFRNELIDLGRRNRLEALRECALLDEDFYFKVAKLDQDYTDALSGEAMEMEADYD